LRGRLLTDTQHAAEPYARRGGFFAGPANLCRGGIGRCAGSTLKKVTPRRVGAREALRKRLCKDGPRRAVRRNAEISMNKFVMAFSAPIVASSRAMSSPLSIRPK
jgi:hypothetical protein